MAAPKERFWARVLFKEFIRHFRKLDDKQIVEDIKQSMDDLDDLNESGSSFGAKMVKWSIERSNEPKAEASRINGALGGRPKNPPPPIPARSLRPKRPSKQDVYDFARQHNIDEFFARNWFARNYEERDGVDKYGCTIANWQGALTNDFKKNGGNNA